MDVREQDQVNEVIVKLAFLQDVFSPGTVAISSQGTQGITYILRQCADELKTLTAPTGLKEVI